jgi:hypothetical protein
VNPYHFLKKHHNRCTLLDMLRKGTFSRIYPNAGLIFSSLSSKLCLILLQIAKSVYNLRPPPCMLCYLCLSFCRPACVLQSACPTIFTAAAWWQIFKNQKHCCLHKCRPSLPVQMFCLRWTFIFLGKLIYNLYPRPYCGLSKALEYNPEIQ